MDFTTVRFTSTFFLVFERTCWWCAEHGSGEGGKDEEAEVAAKQPKRKRPPKKTVEQNLSNINSAESERRCEVRRTEGHHPVTSEAGDPAAST